MFIIIHLTLFYMVFYSKHCCKIVFFALSSNRDPKMISPSKDVKNIAYSKNDIHCTMKLSFPTSLLEVFHQN